MTPRVPGVPGTEDRTTAGSGTPQSCGHAGPCAAVVVAVVRDRVARARLVESTRLVASVQFCATVAEALAAAWGAGARCVVIEGTDAEGTPTDALIAAVRRERPAVPVLAYCEASTVASPEIVAAVQAGASGLLFRGVDDVGVAVRSAIDRAREHAAAAQALRELADAVPAPAHPVVEHCLRHAARPLSVEQAAAALGVHRKTLVTRLAHAGLPEPRAVIAWCRLVHLAHALEEPGRSAERAAEELQFPSPTAMRNLLRRYTGLRPAEVRQNGGLACVLHLFRRALAESAPRAQAMGPGGRAATRRSSREMPKVGGVPPASAATS